MARFSYNEVDNYGAQKNNFFGLRDDKDTAVIRFLYNNINDAEGVAVHEIQVGDRRIDVECLRSYNEPIEKCPLCAAQYKVNAKMFIPVYDTTSNESKIWTRGKSFFSKLSSLCSRYNPLVATPFEVERCGKKGDTNTTYELYPMQSDNSRVEDFPEIKPEGLNFVQKTADELNYYLQTGAFPEERASNTRPQNNPVRPQSNNRENVQSGRETPTSPIRRRPSYGNEDSF